MITMLLVLVGCPSEKVDCEACKQVCQGGSAPTPTPPVPTPGLILQPWQIDIGALGVWTRPFPADASKKQTGRVESHSPAPAKVPNTNVANMAHVEQIQWLDGEVGAVSQDELKIIPTSSLPNKNFVDATLRCEMSPRLVPRCPDLANHGSHQPHAVFLEDVTAGTGQVQSIKYADGTPVGYRFVYVPDPANAPQATEEVWVWQKSNFPITSAKAVYVSDVASCTDVHCFFDKYESLSGDLYGWGAWSQPYPSLSGTPAPLCAWYTNDSADFTGPGPVPQWPALLGEMGASPSAKPSP